MREILFRGKSKLDNRWVYGFYVNKSPNKHQIVSVNSIFPIEIMPSTIGQFTGILDKKNNKVFEGDCIGNAGAYIVWDDNHFCWGFTFKNDPIITPFNHNKIDFEVTGNIHDN